MHIQSSKILIVEDHSVVRVGIKNMLKSIASKAQIVLVENFNQAIRTLSETTFDLIILDINIPGGDAPSMIAQIRNLQKDVRILIFSGYNEQIYAFPYMQAGANGYVSKNASDEEFITAVKSVLNDVKYLSPEMQQRAINQIVHTRRAKVDEHPLKILSSREIEVMQLLLKGYSTAEIGSLIHLQLSTVSTYKMKVFEKLGVKNVVELIEKMKQYAN